MRTSFGVRRKPRVVGQNEGEEEEADVQMQDSPNENQGKFATPKFTSRDLTASSVQIADQQLENTPIVIRSNATKRKKKVSRRVAYTPGDTSMTEDDTDTPAVFVPKKSTLSRQAIEKNALRKSLGSALSSENLPSRQPDERPSYSQSYLNELKSSTPSTPKDLSSLASSDIDDPTSKSLDLAAKFGTDLLLTSQLPSQIPTPGEIAEKKARRARLAKSQDFISLDNDSVDNDDREISTYGLPSEDPEDTPLVPDDEEIAEGFDDYVEDGRIALGRKAEREQRRKQKADIRTLIDEAEGGSSDDASDDSEAERNAAYEAAQTRAGMDGLAKSTDGLRARRARIPAKITPVSTLAGCLERLRAKAAKMEYERLMKERALEAVRREMEDIRDREGELQVLLNEAGEKYRKAREEAGLGANGVGKIEDVAERGLESLGNGRVKEESEED